MKQFRVKVTDDAKSDLKRYRDYLLIEKKSPQAAKNIILDFRETRKKLATVANSLKKPDSPKLIKRGLGRINFLKHDFYHSFRFAQAQTRS